MAQKKKVTSAAKAPAKAAARKAPAKAVAAATSKATVKAKAPVAAAKAAVKPAAPVKAKAPIVAAKPKKAAPLPIKTEAKPVAPAATPKKISAGALKAALASAKSASAAPRAVPAAVQKPGSQKLTAPLQAAGQAAVQTPKAIAEKAAAARQMLAAQKKPVNQRHGFKANEFIVYPAHGVGRIIGIEEQEIAGMSLELFVINFEKEKLTLRVPTGKLESVGMRKLADDGVVKKAMDILKGRARIKRTMWSRRAQEYVAKINSGDLISIAEVVRDLYRSEAQPEQSYSERQLYEDALDRMAREIAAVERLDERGAVQRITDVLSKSAKSRRLTGEGEAVGEAA
ncbi:MAG: CarD family transcriptional regulator [Hyphomicrobiaceae bacterium]|nr:CarD family transcriptional regulator [Hyphomicrobiaceae bacterium]